MYSYTVLFINTVLPFVYSSAIYVTVNVSAAVYVPVSNEYYQLCTIKQEYCRTCTRSTLHILLVGFGRACAPVRCAHPSFWALKHAQRGAARPPPIAASLLLIYPPPKLSLRPELGPPGAFTVSFHWA
jgi:hypothetical protein